MTKRSGHDFKFGIEEEFFLAGARSRGAPRSSIQGFHDDASRLGSVERELLENEVEICSAPTASVDEARTALGELRDRLQATARKHGLKPWVLDGLGASVRCFACRASTRSAA